MTCRKSASRVGMNWEAGKSSKHKVRMSFVIAIIKVIGTVDLQSEQIEIIELAFLSLFSFLLSFCRYTFSGIGIPTHGTAWPSSTIALASQSQSSSLLYLLEIAESRNSPRTRHGDEPHGRALTKCRGANTEAHTDTTLFSNGNGDGVACGP